MAYRHLLAKNTRIAKSHKKYTKTIYEKLKAIEARRKYNKYMGIKPNEVNPIPQFYDTVDPFERSEFFENYFDLVDNLNYFYTKYKKESKKFLSWLDVMSYRS